MRTKTNSHLFSLLIAFMPFKAFTFDYVLHAPVTTMGNNGVFVELYSADSWNSPSWFDIWTIPDGQWTAIESLNTNLTTLAFSNPAIVSEPFQMVQVLVADFIFAGTQYNVTNSKSVFVSLPGGTYWIDFDSSGSPRITPKNKPPRDFGRWNSFGQRL